MIYTAYISGSEVSLTPVFITVDYPEGQSRQAYLFNSNEGLSGYIVAEYDDLLSATIAVPESCTVHVTTETDQFDKLVEVNIINW